MAEQGFAARLRQGVEAARTGDKPRARILLQQVLAEDPSNEVALMWMASVSDSLDDRRFYLQRAIAINPRNDRAREALRRLGVDVPDDVSGSASDANTPRRPQQDIGSYVPNLRPDRRQRGPNAYFVAAILVGSLLIIVLLAALAQQTNNTGQTQTQTAIAFRNTSLAGFPTAEPLTGQNGVTPIAAVVENPTETPFLGVIVTLDETSRALPPSFTPTNSPEPSQTPLPTATPLPVEGYRVLFSERGAGQAVASLYTANGDGSNVQPLAPDVLEFALSPDGQQVAFVRAAGAGDPVEAAVSLGSVEADSAAELTPESGDGPPTEEVVPGDPTPATDPALQPQLYVARVNDPNSFVTGQPLTRLGGSGVADPVWSPDGTSIVFASDEDGDWDLFSIAPTGGEPTRFTFNEARDVQPSFAPDGRSFVYASDVDSPGFTEIYRYTLREQTITRMTDDQNNSYSPAYSPDGLQIAFASDRSGDGDIYVMQSDGSNAVLITLDDNGAEDRLPAWSSDARLVAFASNRNTGNTFEYFIVDVRAGNLNFPLVPFASIGGDSGQFAFGTGPTPPPTPAPPTDVPVFVPPTFTPLPPTDTPLEATAEATIEVDAEATPEAAG